MDGCGIPAAGSIRSSRWRAAAGVAAFALLAGIGAPASIGLAQSLNERLAQSTRPDGKTPMLVEAAQLIYDNDQSRVLAVGDVQIHYKGRILQADRVVYNRKTNRVFAEGNVRLTDETGAVTRVARLEFTDDFRDGFLESLRVEQASFRDGRKVTARFSAPFGERAGGETTTFVHGTFTTCEPCAKDPDRPPLWRVRAKKIIHNNSERTIYYEDASFELFGLPIAWLPYFSTPDPTVKRQTGFLAPRYIASTALGTGVSLPFFINLAPNYDLTVTPTFLSRQGLLGEVEWRHRLMNGAYSIRASGIMQQDPSAFSESPFGPGNRRNRGAIETRGRFYINQNWHWGWEGIVVSDKWYIDQYRFRSSLFDVTGLDGAYFREATSSLYLTGKSDRAWFDLRAQYFQGLSFQDWQRQQPVVHPVLDYNKRMTGPGFLGGEVGLDVNFVSLSRDTAMFGEIPLQLTPIFAGVTPSGAPFSLYEGCAVFARGTCLVRGIAGNYTRFTSELSWRRNIIDPIGQVWMPYASVRFDGIAVNANTQPGTINANLAGFLPADDRAFARVMPTVGLLYRFPFVANAYGVIHTIEPIAQVVARPSETGIVTRVNEDAQSLVFDDTNLFAWNRFSGYDRIEGGVRASFGARYTLAAPSGANASFIFGQSFHLAGTNSYAVGDIANVGLNSGLDSRRSDYVAGLQLAPDRTFTLGAHGRFDERTMALRRFEAQGRASFGPLQASLLYARYAEQPAIGFPFKREGLLGQASLKVSDYVKLSGGVLLDLDRNGGAGGGVRSQPAGLSLGVNYEDECTVFGVSYLAAYRDGADGTRSPVQTLLLRLEFKSLGETTLRRGLTPGSRQDGL